MEKSRFFRIIGISFVAAWLSSAAHLQASPSSLSYSTYFGGSGSDIVMRMAVDAEGNLFLAGYTNSKGLPAAEQKFEKVTASDCGSSGDTFPCLDIFVAKLDPTGQRLLSIALMGGSGDDFATSIAIDEAGNATISGYTNSRDFPVVNAAQSTPGGGSCGTAQQPQPCFDPFVAKLNADGTEWTYITYLGGSGDDLANSIAVDVAGNAVIVGTTTSLEFPVIGKESHGWHGDATDCFVAWIDPTGRLVFSSVFGGTGDDSASSVALDRAAAIYFAGFTNSVDFSLPAGPQPAFAGGTCGALDSKFPCFDAFVAGLMPNASEMDFLKYIGGTGGDYANAIALDSSGGITVVGTTPSRDFPVTLGVPRSAGGGSSTDAFVMHLDPGDGHYVYSTYLGGEGADSAEGVAVDSIGRAIVAGTTWGASLEFTSAGPGGFYDAFLSVLKEDGNAIDDSIRLGGTGHERTLAVTIDRYDNAYIIAQTFSADYPTVRPMQPSYGGGGFDAVVTKVAVGNSPALYAEPSRLDFGPEMVSARSTPQFVRFTNIGSGTVTIDSVTASGDFEASGGCTALAVGDACDWAVNFTPTASGPRVGFLAVMHDGLDNGYLVDLRGVGSAPEIRLSKDSVLFDSQLVGTESGPQEITLVNAGTKSLDLSGIHVTGDFVQSNNCPSNVAVGGSCRIQVSFRPSTAGSHEGALVVTNHLPEEERQTALTGNGSDFALEAPATSMTITAGESASLEFVVTPVAGVRGSLEFTCSGEPPASACSPSPRQVSLDVADPVTIRSSITTAARSQTHPGRKTPLGPLLLLTIFLGIELANLGGLRPRSPWGLRPALVWALALTFVMGVASCGGGSSSYPSPSGATGTPAGSYLVLLTARCGAVSRMTSAFLIIR